MKSIAALALILSGLAFVLKGYEGTRMAGEVALFWFIPGITLIFVVNFFLSRWFLKVIEQPPLMIYILSIVIKMMAGLGLLLAFLLSGAGPEKTGALVFVVVYMIFEILEIKRFISILRPDSQE
jgi:hypothetical protein